MAIATSKETRVRLGFDIASGEKLQFNCSRLDMPDRSKEFLSISQTRTYLRTARRVTESAARLVSARMKGRCPPAARRKAEGDFVTEVDVAAESRLRRQLAEAHPDHGFLGEESGACSTDADLVWVVDPVDGTSNLSRGLSPVAVSVACLHRLQPVAAAVYCFPEGALYSAAKGLGAFRGRQRLSPPKTHLDDSAILGVQWIRGVRRLAFLPRLLETGARIRNHGCTVAQLCDVAMGRLDANLQEQGKIWDVAAAGLIAEEAGARFTDWRGRPIFPFPSLQADLDHPSLAAMPGVHRRLVRLLKA